MEKDLNMDSILQKRLEASMPLIGMYIAAASAICTLAMAVDAFNGFRTKKLWFPSKYFSFNSTSLTLLAVAMKLPMDLTTPMMFDADWNAKITSLVFLSTAMGNFNASLGSMSDEEILTNVIALGIMAVTIVADVWIQLIHLWPFIPIIGRVEMLGSPIFILVLLATLVSSAVSVPTVKRKLELKYKEMHKIALREEEVAKRVKLRTDVLRGEMMKYWVMAETGSPQFVVARSVICASSTGISLLAVSRIPLYYIYVFLLKEFKWVLSTNSAYGSIPHWIVIIQTIGVIIGTIKLILRWFVVVSYNESFKKEFMIETHWIQSLVDWRDNLSTSQNGNYKCRKYLHDSKWLVLNFCIGLQIFIVFTSKLFFFLTTASVSPFFFCFTCIKKFMMRPLSKVLDSDEGMNFESGEDSELHLSHYVLLLEGEAEFPKRTLKKIYKRADKVIQTGKRNQPKNLINLLRKVVNFSGLREFDSNQVPSLHSQEPPNCWTLPVVTLTCIAIVLPGIEKHKVKQLVSSVGEGLALAKIIEETMKGGELINIRNAADVAWVEVALYRKWQDMNLGITSSKFKSKQILQELSNKAEMTVSLFKTEVKDFVIENPLNWPATVIVANSMHRISQTIILSCERENELTDEELFEQLSVMIADILAACLTNLPRVITTMCQHNSIEKRERNIHKAFHLLGQTEEIVELMHQLEWPSLDPDKAICIEEWRTFLLEQHEENPSASSSTSRNETGSFVLNFLDNPNCDPTRKVHFNLGIV